VDILIPMQSTMVTAKTEIRVPFACRHCGFQGVARVVGVGAARTAATVAIGPAPVASEHEHQQARGNALADGQELLALVPCPGCGERGSEAWQGYTRATRIAQVLAAAVLVAIMSALWDPANPAIVVVCAIPSVAVVFLVGYIRGVRAEVPADRVTFLSPEEAAADEAAAAQAVADEAAAEEAAEEAAAARSKKRREKSRRA
jgi:hypothetical protein